jgi:hypothetical protein
MELITEEITKDMTRVFQHFKSKKMLEELIQKDTNQKIVLFRNSNVVNWIFGDLSFIIENIPKSKYKEKEDEWGRNVLKTKRPDLVLDKQWTNKFGEHIIEELYMLINKPINKPNKINHLQPDLESEDFIIEVKTQTYYTTGTASEKILGTPYKYADIPTLYNKPLKIVCIGGCEKALLDFDVLNTNSENKKKILECYSQLNIEFVSFKQLIWDLIK